MTPWDVWWRLPLAMAGMLEAMHAKENGAKNIERRLDWAGALAALSRAKARHNGGKV